MKPAPFFVCGHAVTKNGAAVLELANGRLGVLKGPAVGSPMPDKTAMPPQDFRPPRAETDEEFAKRLLDEHLRLQHAQQLTAAEIEAVRTMIESDKFWKRIGTTLKTWAVTITAVVAAGTVGIDTLKKLITSLGK